MNLKFDIKPTKSQKEAYKLYQEDDTKYLILCWSRQAGKSVFAEIVLIENLFKPNKFSAYISPTFAQGRKVYNELIKILEPTGYIKKANGSTLTIETRLGSTLQMMSIESPTSIRGNTISGVLVIDEAAFIPDTLPDGSEPFSSVIMPITKARKPKTIVISTPKGKRGMFHNLYTKALEGEKGFKYLKTTIYDDSLVDDEEIANIKSLVNPTSFREEFLCEFLDSSLTFFTGFEECFMDYEYDESLPQYMGVDLSSTGEDDTIATLINTKNQTKQFTISGTLDQKYQQLADLINNTKNLKKVLIESNGVGSPMINSIKKLVKNQNLIDEWVTTNESKVRILSQLALDISKKLVFFQKHNTKLFSQFSRFIYKYSKTGKLQLEGQSGSHDDTVLSAAIGYEAKTVGETVGEYHYVARKKWR